MPRFLNTRTGEFETHDNIAEIPYAILSHTWQSTNGKSDEQTYADLLKIQADVREANLKRPGNAPESTVLTHEHLSPKIRGFCKIALEAGFELGWLDSCCIDKSSSAELAETINLMYELYRQSDICYVYLHDVPTSDDADEWMSRFKESRWHTRGWTLQELIAPSNVVFLSSSWLFLGTKLGLAYTLERVTGINADILTGRASVTSVCVAERMRWASSRATTRIEDEAYCLLGIFGVHIPPIYGEGSNAFLRLQEEIIRTIPDQSIFIWGSTGVLSSITNPVGEEVWDEEDWEWDSNYMRRRSERCGPGLLPTTPRHFTVLGDHNTVTHLSPKCFASRLGRGVQSMPPLHCSFTPQGVLVELLCVDLTQFMWPGAFNPFKHPDDTPRLQPEEGPSGNQVVYAHALALLPCEDRRGRLIALPLCRPPNYGHDHRGLSIGTYAHNHPSIDWRPYRFVRVEKDCLEELLRLVPPPSDRRVSLLRDGAEPIPHKSCTRPETWDATIRLWFGLEGRMEFQIAPWCIAPLRTLGFTVSDLTIQHEQKRISLLASLDMSTAVHPQDTGSVHRSDPTPVVEQHVQFRIDLCHAERPKTRAGSTDTEALFTATNSIRWRSPSDRNLPHLALPYSSKDDHTTHFHTGNPQTTLAEAHFDLVTVEPAHVEHHDRLPFGLEKDASVTTRRVRLKLCIPWALADRARCHKIWVAIEVSGTLPPHTHRPGLERVLECDVGVQTSSPAASDTSLSPQGSPTSLVPCTPASPCTAGSTESLGAPLRVEGSEERRSSASGHSADDGAVSKLAEQLEALSLQLAGVMALLEANGIHAGAGHATKERVS
ncbi:hypothetical protein C8Q77DRAFT_747975 [Trametes polyzona]|nr:hypothetical protein C8Q77DRAFT_747975 [Trametes polyzona]